MRQLIFYLMAFLTVGAVMSREPEEVEVEEIVEGELPADSIAIYDEIDDAPYVELTLPEYPYWEKASIEGKLKMRGLPLSPTLKIFLQHDSLADLSIRAPFIGEAGRMILTSDSVIAVNRMNKTYIRESISEYSRFYPNAMHDIQSLLLARVFLPGVNLEETDINEVAEIYYEDDQFNLVPNKELEIEGIKYGYVIDETFRPLLLVVLPEKKPELEIDVEYTYGLKGYDIDMSVTNGSQAYSAKLELKNPEWEGEVPKPLNLDRKYRKVSVSDFLQNIGR